jgi:TctA family transporter
MVTVPYHLLYPAIMVSAPSACFHQQPDIRCLPDGVVRPARLRVPQARLRADPLLLGFILGPPMEEFLRRALILSEGRPDVLLREPLSAGLLALAALLMMSVLLPAIRQKREQTFVAED